jgi:hypothetical protein
VGFASFFLLGARMEASTSEGWKHDARTTGFASFLLGTRMDVGRMEALAEHTLGAEREDRLGGRFL